MNRTGHKVAYSYQIQTVNMFSIGIYYYLTGTSIHLLGEIIRGLRFLAVGYVILAFISYISCDCNPKNYRTKFYSHFD